MYERKKGREGLFEMHMKWKLRYPLVTGDRNTDFAKVI